MSDDEGVSHSHFPSFFSSFVTCRFSLSRPYQLIRSPFCAWSWHTERGRGIRCKLLLTWLTILTPKVSRWTPSTCESHFSSFLPSPPSYSCKFLFHQLTCFGRHSWVKQGINVQDILKLKASGIVTVLGIAQTPRKNLLKIKVSCFYWFFLKESWRDRAYLR
jgi:hypothetical protein